MSWSTITEDWNRSLERLVQRFPYVDPRHVAHPPDSPEALSCILSETHDLTLFEARQELQDWLETEIAFLETLKLRMG